MYRSSERMLRNSMICKFRLLTFRKLPSIFSSVNFCYEDNMRTHVPIIDRILLVFGLTVALTVHFDSHFHLVHPRKPRGYPPIAQSNDIAQRPGFRGLPCQLMLWMPCWKKIPMIKTKAHSLSILHCPYKPGRD